MRNKKKVLVVDDDEMHLYTTKELLLDDRIEVITHKNGFGVTNLVRELKPDLVLLDINMPALSGDNLAALLLDNDHTSRVPIVFHSSNDEDSLRKIVASHGAQGYICKGDVADLRNTVKFFLQLYRQNEVEEI
jgi:CheY-like chemotaxis protein